MPQKIRLFHCAAVVCMGGLAGTVAHSANPAGALHEETRTGQVKTHIPVEPGNCSDLDKLRLVNATVGSATGVMRGYVYYCRVAGVARPTSDSYVNFEIWLPPPSKWNGKLYSSSGGSGLGAIKFDALDQAFARGYAAMSSDRGHAGRDDKGNPSFMGDGTWAAGHPEKVVDFSYRGQHVSTVAAKAIVNAYYDRSAKYAYFESCSAGGHQAVMEAERYPDDFDGIIAAAPAVKMTHSMANGLASTFLGRRGEQYKISEGKLALLHKAAVNSCDALDGAKDGLVSLPLKCSFDPGVLQCKAGDGPNCLTESQVITARALYSGMARSNGQPIAIGYGDPVGSELAWGQQINNTRPTMIDDFFRYWVYNDPKYDTSTFNFDHDFDAMLKMPYAGKTFGEVMDANGNLEPFRQAGGKMIAWTGTSDYLSQPGFVAEYYNAAGRHVAPGKLDEVLRLFMPPGVSHCVGGEGVDKFDMLGALEDWVEEGRMPDRILASQVQPNGSVVRTLPLCAFPKYARYTGKGDINKAQNYECVIPQ